METKIVAFLRSKTSWDQLEPSQISSPWQCVYWFNYLKVMPVFVCLPGALFPTMFSLSTYPPVQSLYLPSCRSVHPCLHASRSSSPPLTSTPHIHYRMALAQSALFPSVVLNYSVFLGQALMSSHCNDFLIICLYVMNEMEMYHHGQTGLAPCQAATPQSGRTGAGRGKQQNK